MKWWIEHKRPNEPSQYHIVITPEFLEPGFYRQTTSINAFRTRELRKRFPFDEDGRSLYKSSNGENVESCSVRDYDDAISLWRSINESLRKLNVDEELVLPEATEHISLWDFYQAIGYDHKKQKYIKTNKQKV